MTKQLIANVPNYKLLEKCRTLIRSRFHIETFGLPGVGYSIYTEQRLPKTTIRSIQAYILGIADATVEND